MRSCNGKRLQRKHIQNICNFHKIDRNNILNNRNSPIPFGIKTQTNSYQTRRKIVSNTIIISIIHKSLVSSLTKRRVSLAQTYSKPKVLTSSFLCSNRLCKCKLQKASFSHSNKNFLR